MVITLIYNMNKYECISFINMNRVISILINHPYEHLYDSIAMMCVSAHGGGGRGRRSVSDVIGKLPPGLPGPALRGVPGPQGDLPLLH